MNSRKFKRSTTNGARLLTPINVLKVLFTKGPTKLKDKTHYGVVALVNKGLAIIDNDRVMSLTEQGLQHMRAHFPDSEEFNPEEDSE